MRPKKIAVYYMDGPIEEQFPELRDIALRRDQAALDRWHEEHQLVYLLHRDDPLPEWVRYFEMSEHYARGGASPSIG